MSFRKYVTYLLYVSIDHADMGYAEHMSPLGELVGHTNGMMVIIDWLIVFY